MIAKAKQMINSSRAVSPVIGVILMVAVTVLLGAVVAGFTTGLGDDLNQNAPDAQIEFDYDNANEQLTVLHSGGDTLNADNTEQLRLAGANAGNMTFDFQPVDTSDPNNANATVDLNQRDITGSLKAGDTLAITMVGDTPQRGFPSDGEVRLVWVGPEGDTSATLAEFDGPAA